MKIYQVGGSVRDKLLGLEPKDIDFVVIGADPESMIRLGYIQVGKAFPVFIDKQGNEYALARRESKIGQGYSGFGFDTKDVTLEEDLIRRDLTINAMALSPEGDIIDPFNGQKDLEDKILRHTSKAFTEDPLRVFRVARFASKLPGFEVHLETLSLMKDMVQADDFKTLSLERVFQEMKGALKTSRPSRFFEVLKEVGALDYYFPELAALDGVPQRPDYHPEGDCWIHTMLVLDQAASMTISY